MKGVRKLACISGGFSAGVFEAHYLIGDSIALFASICCIITLAALLLTKSAVRKRALLISIAAALGAVYYGYAAETVLSPTEALDGESFTVTATVTDYPEYRESSVLLRVKLRESALPQSETLIVSYDKTKLDFRPGDIIDAELTFSSATERFGEYSDLNISKGLTAVARLDGDAELIRSESSIKYFPKELAYSMRAIVSDIFPSDTAPFMRALLTGDRSGLYENTELDTAMAISGIMHVVAVSGMHVAFLVGFLQLILGQNMRLSLVCIPLIWLFVLMVGAPASAVRAGIMQTMLLIAPIFHRENDPVTSLGFALMLILLQNPFACGSVGLQLSFGAMAGIIAFSQPLYEKLKKTVGRVGRVGDYVLATLSSSLSVSVLSVPLIAIHFGYVALYSALTNILCLWIVSLLFTGGLSICLLSLIIGSVSTVLAGLLSYGVRYIAFVVMKVSKLPFAALYVENTAVVVWLILVYAVFTLCLLPKRKKLLLPTALSIAGLALVLLGTAIHSERDSGTLAALSVGNGQCLAFTAHDKTVVVDCGSARTMVNAGAELTQYLGANGRKSIDCLVLTHLDDDHVNGIRRLLCLVDVDVLIMPNSAKYGDSAETYRELRSLARQNDIELQFIKSERDMKLGDINIRFYTPYRRGSSDNNKGLLLTVTAGGMNTLITGDAGAVVERTLADSYDLSATDVLIVGHHGSDYSCTNELVSETRPEYAVISVGNNSYGHPSYRVLSLLYAYDVRVYRTDLDGRVIINAS